MQFGPDVVKAKQAALKIYSIIDRPSKIDVMDASQLTATTIKKADFQGTIEFKDVWFRYPTRLDQWVFKGLNLKINSQEAIAVVGESGSGKSTFISLVMRFYDPEFGTVLIDGIDVRKYNISELRERMGLVMQEPTLFNYSVKENVLYGKSNASNAEVVAAVEVANARQFVESNTLEHRIADEPESLLSNWQSTEYKAQLVEELGQDKYDETLETL